MKKDLHPLLEDFREAIRHDDSWLSRQEPLYRLIESLPPAVALEGARRCLLDFVPYFEQNSVGEVWVREFLSRSDLFEQAKPAKPADFAEEEDRYAFPGAGNFINAVEDFWIALNCVALQEFVRRVVAALSGVVMAEFIVRQAGRDPVRWQIRREMVARTSAAGKRNERDQDSLRWLARDYVMQRKEPWWYEQQVELWLRVVGRIEEILPQ